MCYGPVGIKRGEGRKIALARSNVKYLFPFFPTKENDITLSTLTKVTGSDSIGGRVLALLENSALLYFIDRVR